MMKLWLEISIVDNWKLLLKKSTPYRCLRQLKVIYRFTTHSWHQKTNSPIHESKVMHKRQTAYKKPFLMACWFLFTTYLKKHLFFDFEYILQHFKFVNWRIPFFDDTNSLLYLDHRIQQPIPKLKIFFFYFWTFHTVLNKKIQFHSFGIGYSILVRKICFKVRGRSQTTLTTFFLFLTTYPPSCYTFYLIKVDIFY